MSIFKKIGSFFMNEDSKEKQEIQPKEDNTVGQVFKHMFTKTDPMNQTHFPYEWEQEFFPPLDKKEKDYMLDEIKRWYQIYYDLFESKMLDAIIEAVIKPSSQNEWTINFYKKFPEEFQLMTQSLIQENFHKLVDNRLETYNDYKLIQWKPLKGQNSYEPPTKEISSILKNISKMVINESEENYKKQQEEIKALLQAQEENSTMTPSEQVSEALVSYLNKHKREIIKHCYDRLILENNAFPYYYGQYEKPFKNKLFHKYKLQFNITTYNELVSKAYLHFNKFIRIHGKRELKKWIAEQWDEYINFMAKEYANLPEDELYKAINDDFNKYALSIDFYALVLFKISLDGM